jgi:hypothetical protein
LKKAKFRHMHRRDIFRSLFFRRLARPVAQNVRFAREPGELRSVTENGFKSNWPALHEWPGEALRREPLDEWCINNGELNCLAQGADKMVHLLSHRLHAGNESFRASLIFRFLSQPVPGNNVENFAGFRLGINVILQDNSTATMNENGIDAGVTRNGYLLIGKTCGAGKIDEHILTGEIRLQLFVTPLSTGGSFVKLKALDACGNTVATHSSDACDATTWQGGIALVSHFKTDGPNKDQPTIAVSSFEIEGKKLALCEENNFVTA